VFLLCDVQCEHLRPCTPWLRLWNEIAWTRKRRFLNKSSTFWIRHRAGRHFRRFTDQTCEPK